MEVADPLCISEQPNVSSVLAAQLRVRVVVSTSSATEAPGPRPALGERK